MLGVTWGPGHGSHCHSNRFTAPRLGSEVRPEGDAEIEVWIKSMAYTNLLWVTASTEVHSKFSWQQIVCNQEKHVTHNFCVTFLIFLLHTMFSFSPPKNCFSFSIVFFFLPVINFTSGENAFKYSLFLISGSEFKIFWRPKTQPCASMWSAECRNTNEFFKLEHPDTKT